MARKNSIGFFSLMLFILLLPIVNVTAPVTSVVIIEPDPDSPPTYSYYDTTETFNCRIYKETPATAQLSVKYDSEASYVVCASHPKTISTNYDVYDTYFDYFFVVDIDAFEPGQHHLYVQVEDVTSSLYYYDDARFFRDQIPPPPNSHPTVTVTSPSSGDAFDVATGSITTAATITDSDGVLETVYCYWDDVINGSWSSPTEGTFTHTIPIMDGVTANGTHTIKWYAVDDDGASSEEEIEITIYDTLLLINRIEPTRFFQSSNSFNFKYNFTTDTSDLDEGRFYINNGNILHENSTDISESDIECDTSYSKILSGTEGANYANVSVSYSNVYEKSSTETTEDNFDSNGWATFDDGVRTWAKAAQAVVTESGSILYHRVLANYPCYVYTSITSVWESWSQATQTFTVRFKTQGTYGSGEAYRTCAIKLNYATGKWFELCWYRPGGDYYLYIGYSTARETATISDDYQTSVASNTHNDWHEYKIIYYYSATQSERYIKAYFDGDYIGELPNARLDSMNQNPIEYLMGCPNNGRNCYDYIDWIKSGYEEWSASTPAAVGLGYSLNDTLPTAFGNGLNVTFSSTLSCKFDYSMTYIMNYSYLLIFNDFSGTTTVQTWQISDSAWSQMAEGYYNCSIEMILDSGTNAWNNFTFMFKDITAPTASIASPIHQKDDYKLGQVDGLYYIPNWGLNENQSNSVIVILNENRSSFRRWEWSDTQDLSTRPTDWPTFDRQLVDTDGNHTLRVKLIDYAGNEGSDVIWFIVLIEKPIYFSFIDLNAIAIPWRDAREFEIFIDGFPVYDLEAETILDSFSLQIYDQFGYTLYSNSSIDYAQNIQVTIPVRQVSLQNMINKPVEAKIYRNGRELKREITSSGSIAVFLMDGSYDVLADPGDARRSGNQKYVAKNHEVTISAEITSVQLECNIEFLEGGGGGILAYLYNQAGPWIIIVFSIFVTSIINAVVVYLVKKPDKKTKEEQEETKRTIKAGAEEPEEEEEGGLGSIFRTGERTISRSSSSSRPSNARRIK